MDIRPDWNSTRDLPPVPFFHKTSVRSVFFLFSAGVTALVALESKKIGNIARVSLYLTSAVSVVAAIIVRLFPSQKEHSSLLKMRRQVGNEINQHLGVRAIKARYSEALRLGAIHPWDLDKIMRADFANFALSVDQLHERHDFNTAELLMDNHINYRLRIAQGLPDFLSDRDCYKYAGTRGEVLRKLVAAQITKLEAPEYTVRYFIQNFGISAVPLLRSSPIMQQKIVTAINSGEITFPSQLLCLTAEHIYNHSSDYISNTYNKTLIEDSRIPQELMVILKEVRKSFSDNISSGTALILLPICINYAIAEKKLGEAAKTDVENYVTARKQENSETLSAILRSLPIKLQPFLKDPETLP